MKKGKQSYDIASLFPVNEEYIKRSRPKVTPTNDKPMLLSLIFSSIAFITTPFVPSIWKKKRPKTMLEEEKNIFNLSKPAQIIASIAAGAMLIFLLALSQYPEIFDSGLPKNLRGLSPWQIILIHIPLLVIILTITLLVFLFIVLKKRLWNMNLRLYFLLVIVLLFINLGLLNYWNLLRMI